MTRDFTADEPRIRTRSDQKNRRRPMKYEDVTERAIGAFYQVYNTLGWGFLEKVYQNALAIELDKRGLRYVPQAKLDVYYDNQPVGEYFADFLVEDCVILELKAVEQLAPEHEAQLVNYLKASTIDVGLLLNFGPKPQVRRKIFETARMKPDLVLSLPSDPAVDPR
jgi:GxxExxY protein